MLIVSSSGMLGIIRPISLARDHVSESLFRLEWESTVLRLDHGLSAFVGQCRERKVGQPFVGRLRYTLTPLSILDVMAIAPFYMPLVAADLRVSRVMRIFRIMRVLKFGRYSNAFRVLGNVLHRKRQGLAATITILPGILVISATLMYEVEGDAQPAYF